MKELTAKGLVAQQGQRPVRSFQGASEKTAIHEKPRKERRCSTGYQLCDIPQPWTLSGLRGPSVFPQVRQGRLSTTLTSLSSPLPLVSGQMLL